jgi:hypothetical protein
MSDHPETHVAEDNPDIAATVATGVVGVALLVGIVVALQGLYNKADAAEFRQKVEAQAPVELQDLQSRQRDKISRWVKDPATGVVRMPIDRAMELVVSERAGQAARP